MEGYRQHFEGSLVTVWSAPNYCYRLGNVAAILEIDENFQKYYKVYEAAPSVIINFQLFKIVLYVLVVKNYWVCKFNKVYN